MMKDTFGSKSRASGLYVAAALGLLVVPTLVKAAVDWNWSAFLSGTGTIKSGQPISAAAVKGAFDNLRDNVDDLDGRVKNHNHDGRYAPLDHGHNLSALQYVEGAAATKGGSEDYYAEVACPVNTVLLSGGCKNNWFGVYPFRFYPGQAGGRWHYYCGYWAADPRINSTDTMRAWAICAPTGVR